MRDRSLLYPDFYEKVLFFRDRDARGVKGTDFAFIPASQVWSRRPCREAFREVSIMSIVENDFCAKGQTMSQHRVLVVDDNDDVADCLVMLLRRLGYLARACCSARDCLECLYEFRPHVILLDLSMPVWDGFDTCRRIRHCDGFEDIPVIACSALDPCEVQERAADGDFFDHLVKPIGLRELHAAVEHALDELATQAAVS